MLQGPPEVLPVPGATVTAPTQYAYAVADLVTSVVLHRVYRRAGKNAILVDAITLVDEGSTQKGEITFANGSSIVFTAQTSTQLLNPLLFGANVWNWHVGGGGRMGEDGGATLDPAAGNASNVSTTRVQFLSLVPGPPNTTQVTIHAEPGTPFEDCYGTSDVASVRATFFRLNNIANNSSRNDLAWTTHPPALLPVPPALP